VPNKVFISYSHDSEQHSQRVLDLANQLRQHGVDAELDQYETRPPQGWPRWCEEQLRPENSDYVLVVCTETYLQRIEGKVPAGEGLGVFWEGDVIYSYLYEQKSKERFIPILFDRKDETNIPRPLKGAAHFQLGSFDFSDSGYKSLYRELTHQPVEKPPLGERVSFRGGTRGLPRGVQEDLTILPAVAPRTVRSTPETDLLEELKRLPAAWFDELVFHFDTNGAVSTKPAPQAIRAIDLLTVARNLDNGPARLREAILRLKENRG
jgi:TIR domain